MTSPNASPAISPLARRDSSGKPRLEEKAGSTTAVKLAACSDNRSLTPPLSATTGSHRADCLLNTLPTSETVHSPAAIDVIRRVGTLQADALAQYESLFGAGKATHVCCLAHARRKFVAAADGGDGRANGAVELFGRLYAIERGLPPQLPPSDDPTERNARAAREAERRRLRQRDADPILAELKAWLDATRPSALPKSALGAAIGYATNNWAALTRYRDEGNLAIDNNLAERTLRAIALGRNNWGVFGSESGGRTAATLYSVVSTCKHLGIDPFAYLRDTLPGLFALGDKPTAEQLLDWLPDRWLLRTRANTARPASAA